MLAVADESLAGRNVTPAGRTALDIALILLVAGAMIAICARGPCNTYAYAQAWNAGTGMGILERGDWLLPRDQMGRVPRKPPLLAWAEAAVLSVVPVRDDFVFRVPTILAGLATAVLVYLFGRRWFDRRTGLLAACLWLVGLHMGKQLYLVTTDMLLTLWITASIFSADRLLFNRTSAPGRTKWLIGLWASMILAALSKGWGIVSVPVVGGFVALASALEPGFGELGGLGLGARLAGAARLVPRRWGAAIRRVGLGWGLLAMVAVLGALLGGQLLRGGQELRDVMNFEIVQRATGGGDSPPSPSHGPRVLNLIYFALPGSVFAIGAVILGSRRMVRPLCWAAAVVVPFLLPHGFRSDYLLPAYGAVALMGGWAVEELVRRRANRGRAASAVRHMIAAAPVVIGLGLAGASLAYLLRGHMPQSWQRLLPMPIWTQPETWYVVSGLVAVGAATLGLAVFTSLAWRIHALAWVTIISMLGVHYFASNILSRHAVQPDGEIIRAFSMRARSIMGRDSFAVTGIRQLGCELYIGRFGRTDSAGQPFVSARQVDLSDAAWLIVADRGLLDLGAAEADPNGDYKAYKAGRYRTTPQDLGQVVLASAPVRDRDFGRVYLIRLRRPLRLSGQASQPSLQPDDE